MLLRLLFGLLCTLCASAVNASAQQRAVTENPLQPFAWPIGRPWVAEGEIPGAGKYTAQRTYRWTLEGRFIEMEQVMRVGGAQSIVVGIIGWDAGKSKVAAWGFADEIGRAHV